MSSQRAERRDVQLLERAELLLAHDRHRRQVGRDHEQQQREHAGDHEVAALELRVEPDADARLDRRLGQRGQSRARSAASISCAYSPIRLARVAERDRRRVRVGAVGDHLHA